jgi:hypothetical protein
MTEAEINNQLELLKLAFVRGVEQAGEITDRVILESTPMLYNKGYQNGFWYGFAAGAVGMTLALVITWMIYS